MDLFMAAAAAVTSRLRQAGYPLVVAVEKPGIERRDNGWASTLRPGERNVLAEDLISTYRIAPLLRASDTDLLNECAGMVVSACGSTLPFATALGAQVWPLIEPFEMSRRDPPTYENDPVAWVARAIVHRALLWHLQRLPSPAVAEHGAAETFAEEVLQFAHDDQLRHRVAVPLSGIKLGGNADRSLMEGPVTIRTLSDAEQGEWLEASQTMRSPFSPFELPEVSLEIGLSGPRQEWPTHSARAAMPLISAMQLHGYTPAGLAGELHSDPEWAGVAFWRTPLELPGVSGRSRIMSADDLRVIIGTADRIRDYDRVNPRSAAELALRRFATGAARRDDADALLDFTIALEVLLLPDDREAGRGDLGYRFRMHGAHYLANDAVGRREVFRQLRDIYDARSGLVHGGRRYPSPGDLTAARDRARELAGRGLLRAVRDGFPSAGLFNNLILGGDALPHAPASSTGG